MEDGITLRVRCDRKRRDRKFSTRDLCKLDNIHDCSKLEVKSNENYVEYEYACEKGSLNILIALFTR